MMNVKILEVKFDNQNLFLDNFDNMLTTRWQPIRATQRFDNWLVTCLVPPLAQAIPIPRAVDSLPLNGDPSHGSDADHTDTHQIQVRISVRGRRRYLTRVTGKWRLMGARRSNGGFVKVDARLGVAP